MHQNTLRRLAYVVAAVAALTVAALGAAAGPEMQAHENFSDSFDDEFCGIAGTSVVRGVDNLTVYSDNTFSDRFELIQTFTATGGKSVRFHAAQHVTGNWEPIDNGDGTLTFVNTFKGMPEQLKLPNGRVLSRDAGVVTFTDVIDATTDELISQTVSGEKGPHPDLDSDFEIFCNVVAPALS